MAIAAPTAREGVRTPAALTRVVAAIGCLLLAVTPALVALSQHELRSALAAFQRGDCARTADAALASIGYLGVRPQAYELLAYCDVRAGLPELAVKMMRKALARDPQNWEYHYGLALVRGAAGLDPRPQLREALRRNPRNTLVLEASRALSTDDPTKWRRRALEARLPIRSS
jgi:Tfp pilus assembly protein PilF